MVNCVTELLPCNISDTTLCAAATVDPEWLLNHWVSSGWSRTITIYASYRRSTRDTIMGTAAYLLASDEGP
jgi:hypothetical protein